MRIIYVVINYAKKSFAIAWHERSSSTNDYTKDVYRCPFVSSVSNLKMNKEKNNSLQ